MDLGELADRFPDRDAIRRELERLADRVPSHQAVRNRVSEFPAAAQRWLPGRREPAWSDTLTVRSVATFGAGMALGAALTALLNPRSGPALRRDLIERVHHLREAGLGRQSVSRANPEPGDDDGAGTRLDLSH